MIKQVPSVQKPTFPKRDVSELTLRIIFLIIMKNMVSRMRLAQALFDKLATRIEDISRNIESKRRINNRFLTVRGRYSARNNLDRKGF